MIISYFYALSFGLSSFIFLNFHISFGDSSLSFLAWEVFFSVYLVLFVLFLPLNVVDGFPKSVCQSILIGLCCVSLVFLFGIARNLIDSMLAWYVISMAKVILVSFTPRMVNMKYDGAVFALLVGWRFLLGNIFLGFLALGFHSVFDSALLTRGIRDSLGVGNRFIGAFGEPKFAAVICMNLPLLYLLVKRETFSRSFFGFWFLISCLVIVLTRSSTGLLAIWLAIFMFALARSSFLMVASIGGLSYLVIVSRDLLMPIFDDRLVRYVDQVIAVFESANWFDTYQKEDSLVALGNVVFPLVTFIKDGSIWTLIFGNFLGFAEFSVARGSALSGGLIPSVYITSPAVVILSDFGVLGLITLIGLSIRFFMYSGIAIFNRNFGAFVLAYSWALGGFLINWNPIFLFIIGCILSMRNAVNREVRG